MATKQHLCSWCGETSPHYLRRGGRKKGQLIYPCIHCRRSDRYRERYPDRRKRNGVYANGGAPKGSHEALQVNGEPFRQWLIELYLRYEIGDLVGITSLEERRINAVLYEQDEVRLDTVDAALLNTGTFLWELYPELYAFEEVA